MGDRVTDTRHLFCRPFFEGKRMTAYIKKRRRNSRKSANRKSLIILAIVIAISLALIALLTLFLFAFPNANPSLFWITIGLMLLMLMTVAFVVLSSSNTIIRFSQRVKQRDDLVKLVVSVFFGVMITGSINVAALSFSQAQYELADRAATLHFTLAISESGVPGQYELSSPVGSASDVSLEVEDSCYFRYDGIPCELNVVQPTRVLSNENSLDIHNRSLLFEVETRFMDYETAERIITEKIYAELPAAEYVSVGRRYKISFFDPQNQMTTYYFSDRDSRIQLASTSAHSSYRNNITTLAFDAFSYDRAVDWAIDSLMAGFTYSDEPYAVARSPIG